MTEHDTVYLVTCPVGFQFTFYVSFVGKRPRGRAFYESLRELFCDGPCRGVLGCRRNCHIEPTHVTALMEAF